MPSLSATDSTAAHSDGYSCWTSATIRTARSRNSGGYLLFVPDDMTPSFLNDEVSGNSGAIQCHAH